MSYGPSIRANVALISSAAILLLSSCEEPAPQVDEEADVMLDGALAELADEPGRWERVVEDLIDGLESSESEILGYVEDMYYGMLEQSAGEFSCRLEFTGTRIRQRLQEIGYLYWPKRFSRPEIAPVVCSTGPADPIGLDTPVVTYYGYDLGSFAGDAEFHASLLYSDIGEVVLEPAGVVAMAEEYALRLDLQGEDVQSAMMAMDPRRGPLLVLKWGDAPVHDDTGAHSMLPLVLPPLARPHEVVDELGPFGGDRGEWYAEAMCPDGMWMTGASVRIQASLGAGGDDSSLNGISLACSNTSYPADITEVRSGTGFWGDWESAGACDAGYAVAARMRLQAPQDAGDDTGAVDVEFGCQGDSGELSGKTHHPWGEWTLRESCPTGSAICGLRTRIEAQQGANGDDSGMTDAAFTCCRVF